MRHGVVLVLLTILSITMIACGQDAPNAQIVFMDDRLLVREMPFPDSTPLGHLESGAVISIIGRSADNLWLETTAANGAKGWISADFVRVVEDLPSVPITNERNLIGMSAELSRDVVKNIRDIYRRGQAAGNNSAIFSKVGDSITASPHVYEPIGDGLYDLGNFYYLQETVDHFTQNGLESNAFNQRSFAAAIGWTASAVLNPRYAEAGICRADESPLSCEYRIKQPAFALIMFGTNDVGIVSKDAYRSHMQQIIDITLANNIVPIVSTIPPRVDYWEETAAYSDVVRQLAETYEIPLWDYGKAMGLLPEDGLDIDGVHPSIPPLGVRGAADFRTHNLGYGYVIRNLTALQMLDVVWQSVRDISE